MSGRIIQMDQYEELEAKYNEAMAELEILRDGWKVADAIYIESDYTESDMDSLQDDYESVKTRLNALLAESQANNVQ